MALTTRDPQRAPVQAATRDLGAALLVFGTAVPLCLLLRFAPATETVGLSWYGVRSPTAVPFVAAGLAVAALQRRAAVRLPPEPGFVPTRRALTGSSVLVLGVVLTPYSLGEAVETAHTAATCGLFAVQVAYAGWCRRRAGGRVVGALCAAQWVAGAVATTSLVLRLPSMLYAEIVFEAVFGVLVLTALRSTAAAASPRRP